jgi:hypothetical protein
MVTADDSSIANLVIISMEVSHCMNSAYNTSDPTGND